LRPLATARLFALGGVLHPLQGFAALAFGQFDQSHHLQSIDVVGPGGEYR
jgi:hypothetical protein